MIGLIVFHRRTRRDHIARVDPATTRPQQDRTATVVVSVSPDGRLRIHATTGPVVVYGCPHDLGTRLDPPAVRPQAEVVHGIPAARLGLEFIEPVSPPGPATDAVGASVPSVVGGGTQAPGG